MNRRWRRRRVTTAVVTARGESRGRLVTDGGEHDESDGGERPESDDGEDRHESSDENGGSGDGTPPEGASGADRSDVEVTEAAGADPTDPKWEPPDLNDIPEFETGADQPVTRSGGSEASTDRSSGSADDPTAGMPNTARSPGDSRISREGTEGYITGLELCARLPEDVRLPEEAADLVPAAVEAELEQDVQSFAAAEFDNPSPHVDVLDFVERDGELWLRLRLGVPAGAFDDLDPEAVRSYALQQLEGMF